MNVAQINNVTKTFGKTHAVNDLSFEVRKGEIFGLLGPNGAGKTTCIRLMLDIFKPDRGTISILGGAMSEEKKDRIGYLPEDRGLYQDIPLERCLVYLGTLKGLSSSEARKRVTPFLEKFDLSLHKKKKIKELSKGMQQKAQIIATLLHQPELIIIDEPFSGLDPVNTQMVKDMIRNLRNQGTTILMSTHQMRQVEELCERILLINEGRGVLYGKLEDIQRQHTGSDLYVRIDGSLPPLPCVLQIASYNKGYKLTLGEGISSQEILRALIERNIRVEQFEIAVPSLDEIFIRTVKKVG
ncbi:ATP-binding cassette domain-containing protein [Candidatus Sumerlaeota bacterium]|nr:ATP-binding cassette domain-containing protein [Candidatus Sumerlaeota bacterium]